jgi:hypothetical protein
MEPANAPPLEIAKDSHIIYPKNYRDFDPKNIVFSEKICKAGGGQVIFLSYIYPDSMTRPLLLHTPRDMYSPRRTSFRDEKKDKLTMLLSLGHEWEANEQKREFKQICEAIVQRCAEVTLEKKWMGATTIEQVLGEYSPILDTDLLAANVSVITSGINCTQFFGCGSSAISNIEDCSCLLTGILRVVWVFSEQVMGNVHRNIRLDLFQAVVKRVDEIQSLFKKQVF